MSTVCSGSKKLRKFYKLESSDSLTRILIVGHITVDKALKISKNLCLFQTFSIMRNCSVTLYETAMWNNNTCVRNSNNPFETVLNELRYAMYFFPFNYRESSFYCLYANLKALNFVFF